MKVKVEVKRRVAEWRIETWSVDVPADYLADAECAEDAALDAMYDGHGEIVRDESDGYVDMLDGEIIESRVVDVEVQA